MAARKAGKPSWEPTVIIEKGLNALDFALTNRADIEPRLAAGVLDGLTTDLGLVGAKIPGVLQKKIALGTATKTERLSATETKSLLMKLRRAVLNAPPGSVDAKSFGTGTRVDERINKTVIAAGNTLVAYARLAPDQARAAGILEADVAKLEAGVIDLGGKDTAQGTAKRSAKAAARDRDATLARIEQGMPR